MRLNKALSTLLLPTHAGAPQVPQPPLLSVTPAHHRQPNRLSCSLNSFLKTPYAPGSVEQPRASSGTGSPARAQCCPWPLGVTFINVEGIGSQAQGAGADAAAEALSVEEVTLCTQTLHHIHALLTEGTGVAATQVQGKGLSQRFLGTQGIWESTAVC